MSSDFDSTAPSPANSTDGLTLCSIDTLRQSSRIGSIDRHVVETSNGRDSDDVFGEFVTLELHKIIDEKCRHYTKLQIRNILCTVGR